MRATEAPGGGKISSANQAQDAGTPTGGSRLARRIDSPIAFFRSTQMHANSRLACLGAAFVCAFSPSAHADPPRTDWVADSLGCKVVNPQPQPFETITWSGRCKDGFADGAGTVAWFSKGKVNGITSGTFKEGKLNGKGYVTLPHALDMGVNVGKRNFELPRNWPFGSRLDGEFVENQLIGDGIITTPNGRKVVVIQIDGKLVRKRVVARAPTTPERAPPR